MEAKVEADPASGRFARKAAAGNVKPAAVSKKAAAAADDAFGGLTVGQLLGPGALACKLRLNYDLGDAASALIASGQTAAAVTDRGDHIVGLFTENDIMRAIFEGAWPTHRLGDWFDTGMARGSDALIQKLTVRTYTPLSEVAERMVKNAISGDCACHHVLVREADGLLCGVLSALDMVQALCRPGMWDHVPQAPPSSLQAASTMQVKDIMKPRENVFTCLPSQTMKEAIKVLLMTQQNSALVVDEHGIYGIITPRDAVRAFADGVPSNVRLSEWLSGMQPQAGPRVVASDAPLLEAAELMAAQKMNHLVVVLPATMEAVGTLSSLDVAVCTNARIPLMRSVPQWTGPTVGELVGKHWHLTAVCNKGATLQDAAELLSSSGRTSSALALSDDTAPLRLLTETDLMHAYLDGWERESLAESWMKAKLVKRSSVPQHLLVPPSVHLTEAAAMMLNVAKPGGEPFHHLVVKGPKHVEGGWLGVFSALDVARGLASVGSELEVARTGADATSVAAVMLPIDAVLTCRPTDTVQEAFKMMVRERQDALLVVSENTKPALVTARCALQALAEAIPHSCTLAEFMLSRPDAGPREITPETKLLDAASIMTSRTVHHLLVSEPRSGAPVGVLSSMDLVRAVVSIRNSCPFSSLGWLWACRGPFTCTLR